MKTIYVVFNAKSGGSLSESDLRVKFKSAGLHVKKFIPLSGTLKDELMPAIKDQAIVAVVGGDGSVNATASILVNTRAVLAPLPGGTLNHFSKDAGVAQDIDTALQEIAHRKSKIVDVGMVNDQVFINNSSIGIYPSSLLSRERLEGSLGKWPAAVAGLLRAFSRFRTYKLHINGMRVVTPFLFVGNNIYNLNDFGGTDRMRLNEGVLSVYVARAHTRLQLMKLFAHALVGRLHDAEELDVYSTSKELRISSSRSHIHVSYDGEVTMLKSPIIYRIHPKSLRII